LDSEWNESYHPKFGIASEGALYVIAFCCALRGEGLPLVDLHGTQKHWLQATSSEPPHIVIALLGRFKGELGENYHLLPIVTVTSSDINNWLWIGRLLDKYKKLNINARPLFRSKMDTRLKAVEFEPQFLIGHY
jgi:hypothetical protein